MRFLFPAVLCVLTACPPVPERVAPTPPPPSSADAPLSLGLAGAPVELFGSVEQPDFSSVFEGLAEDGFDLFFPLFLTSEVDGVAETTGHLTHFFTPVLFGSDDALTCKGGFNPYTAAADRIDILLPGFILMGEDPRAPLDVPQFELLLDAQAADCWPEHSDVVRAFDSYDEPALAHAVDTYAGEPTIEIDNIARAAAIVHDRWNLPTTLIEGPGDKLFAEAGLAGNALNRASNGFWEQIERYLPAVDQFGFDVYPVPDGDLTEASAWVERARGVAPNAKIVSVLQGFGYGHTTGGATPGREPTLEETRFMAIDSVVAGADALFWYGQSALVLSDPDDAALWASIRAVVAELAPLRSSILGPIEPVEIAGAVARAHRQPDESVVIWVARRETEDGEVVLQLAPGQTIEAVVGPPPQVGGTQATWSLGGHRSGIYRLR